MDVKPERSGWRDAALSLRHREWGVACPAVDIDFLLVEYARNGPVALIEYKNEYAVIPHEQHPSFNAVRVLANNSRIPFYLCRYATDFEWFEVTALNPVGDAKLGARQRQLCERQYVKFLYYLRYQTVPAEIEAKLKFW